MENISPQIGSTWKNLLQEDFKTESFKALKQFLVEEKKQFQIYPSGKDIFAIFNCVDVDNVKVIILGQDPYHGEGQAHGLSFSVPDGQKIPPSLKNIYKELESDLNIKPHSSGNLKKWARQGVFLLNATLTVRAKTAGSHQNKGWEPFTDAVISKLSSQRKGLVFMLWGKYAQDKAQLIDGTKHLILSSPHPSPFSAHRGFLGNQHFSKANKYLSDNGVKPIEWDLSK